MMRSSGMLHMVCKPGFQDDSDIYMPRFSLHPVHKILTGQASAVPDHDL